MSTGYKIFDIDTDYFLTFQIVGWVDILTSKIYHDIIIESFNSKRFLKIFEGQSESRKDWIYE